MTGLLVFLLVAQSLPMGSLPIGSVAESTFDVGFDFRTSLAFVTDPPYATFVDGASGDGKTQTCPPADSRLVKYPTTCTVHGLSVTYGFENPPDTGPFDRNRMSTADPRVAGCVFVPNSVPVMTFRVDLPDLGSYKVQALFGDGTQGYDTVNYALIRDGAGTTLWALSGGSACSTLSYTLDVNCNPVTISPNLGTLASTPPLSFSASTIFRLVLGNGAAVNNTVIAHLRIIKQ